MTLNIFTKHFHVDKLKICIFRAELGLSLGLILCHAQQWLSTVALLSKTIAYLASKVLLLPFYAIVVALPFLDS